MSIPTNYTLPAGTSVITSPAKTITKVIPAVTKKVTSIDFTKMRWLDDQGAQTVTAFYKGPAATLPPIVIMGASTKTPYDPDWKEDDARTAFLNQLSLPIPPPGT